jgi:hypothetical protein
LVSFDGSKSAIKKIYINRLVGLKRDFAGNLKMMFV